MRPLGYGDIGIWHMRDFNHLFSNLGYIITGVLFNCIVFFRQENYAKLSKKEFDSKLHGKTSDKYKTPDFL